MANFLHFRSSSKHDVECNFLQYRQVVSAIPKRLFDKAKEKQVDKRAFLAENAFQLSPNTTIDLHRMKNKDYYWLLGGRVKYGLDPWTFGLFFGLYFWTIFWTKVWTVFKGWVCSKL